jgi:hypothetical protein
MLNADERLIGPLLAGALYDRFSDYSALLMVCSSLLLVSAILQISLGRFPKSFPKPVRPMAVRLIET